MSYVDVRCAHEVQATHASFFSGVGGLDLGLERAGWRTVSFSEIDPYASAVLAERWPSVPNLGDIVQLAGGGGGWLDSDGRRDGAVGHETDGWLAATLWSAGFPCQDLSVAGKRAGFTGQRSVLAFAFLDLVERYRPPAVLLENVPGLLSSHRGRDMAALLGRLVELGYGVAYRVLDARYFGVPQRRRRVFIVGLRSDHDDPDGRVAAECAAAVLAVGTRCRWHPPTGVEAGPEPTDGANDRLAPALTLGPPGPDHNGRDEQIALVSPATYAGRDGAADGMAGRLDGSTGLANAVRASDGHHGYGSLRGEGGDNPVVAPTLRVGAARNKDGGPGETVPVIVAMLNSGGNSGGSRTEPGEHPVAGVSGMSEDPLLPLGLDSHRYRCCGNGVVAPVAEWVGRRLLTALRGKPEDER